MIFSSEGSASSGHSFYLTTFAVGLGASQIDIEEDITKIFPDDERVAKLDYVFRNSRFVERLVIMVSVKRHH